MKLEKLAGATSEIWQIFIQDKTSTTGAGLTGLLFNTASLTAYYHRDTDTTATVITLVTMTVGTFTSSGFKEIDATNMPGWYQFCPPNAALAAGAKSCGFHLKSGGNMADLPIEVQLTAVDFDNATSMGISRIDAAISSRMATFTPLTAAQIATGVWQDATAGDFTTAGSIGKTLYINNIAPGGSGGLLISGSNAGTTTFGALTVTGTMTVSDGIAVTRSSANTSAVTFTGNGTGHGFNIQGGSGATGNGLNIAANSTNGKGTSSTGIGTGAGLAATGGANGDGITSTGTGNGHGINSQSGNGTNSNALMLISNASVNGAGIACSGSGAGPGIGTQGGATGVGIDAVGGATSGAGIVARGSVSGNGMTFTGVGSGSHGIAAAGGTNADGARFTGAGTGHGFDLIAGATGNGLKVTTSAGDGISVTPTAGSALVLTANGTSKHGAVVTGGTAGTSDGIKAVAGTGGVDIRGNLTGNITGTLDTVTNLTNLPSIPANWLTAAGIAAGALNGKGDWLLAASYTAPPSVASIATGVWTDTVAGDFTVALSIGKSIMNGVALGTGLTVNDLTTKSGFALSAAGLDLILMTDLGAPPASNAKIANGLSWLFMSVQNDRKTTSTQDTIANSANAVVGTATVSDDTVTYEKTKYA